MAKVNQWSVALAALLFAGGACAAAVPDDALRAESQKRWDDALAIYRLMLEADPDRADLWLRSADVHAAAGHTREAAAATAEAVRLRPNDAALQARLSQAYAASDQPAQALQAIRRAVALKPDQTEYLRSQAQLALWNRNLDLALATNRQLLALDAKDREALLGIAHAQFMSGALDESVKSYARYHAAYPKDADALLAWADAQMYRGNFHEADRLQAQYRQQAGATPAYLKARAGLQARSGRPRAALELLKPQLAQSPQDYDLNLSRTLALHSNREPARAIDSLPTLDRLGPTRPETRGAHLQVETPQRTNVLAGARYSSDTDDVDILHLYAGATISPTAKSQLSLLFSHDRLEAPFGSGLEALDGDETVELDELALAGRYQFSALAAGRAQVGRAENDRDDSTTTYLLGLDLWPSDRFTLSLERIADVLTVSPRTVDLFIERDRNRVNFGWQPGDRSFFDGILGYDLYSDGNRRSEVTLAPRWALRRTESYNIDVGLRGQWFSFEQNLSNGYYDPDEFYRLWLVGYGYWKLSDNDGIGLVVGLGPERDMTLDDAVKLGGDVSAEGTFGIYRDWQLKASAGYGGRFTDSGAGSAVGDSDSYRGYFVGLELMRRF